MLPSPPDLKDPLGKAWGMSFEPFGLIENPCHDWSLELGWLGISAFSRFTKEAKRVKDFRIL